MAMPWELNKSRVFSDDLMLSACSLLWKSRWKWGRVLNIITIQWEMNKLEWLSFLRAGRKQEEKIASQECLSIRNWRSPKSQVTSHGWYNLRDLHRVLICAVRKKYFVRAGLSCSGNLRSYYSEPGKWPRSQLLLFNHPHPTPTLR